MKELISGYVLLPEFGGILPVTIMVTKDNYLVKMITTASTIYLKQPFKSPPSQLQSKQSLYITNMVSTKKHLKTKHATHTTTKQPYKRSKDAQKNNQTRKLNANQWNSCNYFHALEGTLVPRRLCIFRRKTHMYCWWTKGKVLAIDLAAHVRGVGGLVQRPFILFRPSSLQIPPPPSPPPPSLFTFLQNLNFQFTKYRPILDLL